jgi:hypothetical protein
MIPASRHGTEAPKPATASQRKHGRGVPASDCRPRSQLELSLPRIRVPRQSSLRAFRTHLATRSGEAVTKNVTCSQHRQAARSLGQRFRTKTANGILARHKLAPAGCASPKPHLRQFELKIDPPALRTHPPGGVGYPLGSIERFLPLVLTPHLLHGIPLSQAWPGAHRATSPDLILTKDGISNRSLSLRIASLPGGRNAR